MLELNHFYNMDCLEGMKFIESGTVDMLFADLPFGITESVYDKVIPFVPMWKQIMRIIKDNGAIVLMGCQPFTSDLIQSNREFFRYEWIWKMRQPRNFLNANRMPMRGHIDIPVFYRHLPAYHPQKTKGHKPVRKYCKHSSDGSNYGKTEINTSGGGQTDRYPTTIIDIPYRSIKNRIHSQQKPVELFEWLIRTYSDAGQTVCDITAGSGTTGIACLNTGRNFILFEKDQGIYKKAINRLEAVTAQQSFFRKEIIP